MKFWRIDMIRFLNVFWVVAVMVMTIGCAAKFAMDKHITADMVASSDKPDALECMWGIISLMMDLGGWV